MSEDPAVYGDPVPEYGPALDHHPVVAPVLHEAHLYMSLGDVIQMTGVMRPAGVDEVAQALRSEIQARLGNAGYSGAQLVNVVNDPDAQGYILTVRHADFPEAGKGDTLPVCTLSGEGAACAVAWPDLTHPVGTAEDPVVVKEPGHVPTAEDRQRERDAALRRAGGDSTQLQEDAEKQRQARVRAEEAEKQRQARERHTPPPAPDKK